MRTFKSILLAGSMLLAIPAFFSSCKENAPELDYEMKVTVVNDFTNVVDAINQSNVSKEQAIKNIAAAIDNMRGDQKDKLQAIVAALNSTNTTLEKQLNVIAGAMQSMSIDLPAKVDLIKTAVEGRLDYNEKLEAVKAAFENINPNSQLETLNTLLDKYGKNFTDRLATISGAFITIGYGNAKLDQIKTAIESLGGYGGKLDAINTQMTVLLQALESGNISDKEAMAEVAFVSKINNNYIFFGHWTRGVVGSSRWTSAVVESNPTLVKCLYFESGHKTGKIVVSRDDNERNMQLPIRPVYVKRAAKE